MATRIKLIVLLTVMSAQMSLALEPGEILVIVNSEIPASHDIGQYYCQKRGVPADNLIALPLGKKTSTSISRKDYDRKIAEPLRAILNGNRFAGKIRCLLTTYGVPLTVKGRGQMEGKEEQLKQVNDLIKQGNEILEKLNAQAKPNPAEKKNTETKLAQLKLVADIITGKETGASVDSELSMVLFEKYELYRWQLNPLQEVLPVEDPNDKLPALRKKTMMVSRLDGPSEEIIKSLVDKALTAEQTGLKGIAYFDSRGRLDSSQYGQYDQSIRDIAAATNSITGLPVKQEQTSKLFEPNSCPQAAIYCGWYSLRKYIDAFDFVDGAVGYHIASFEAVGLRDPNATTWCPAMLKDGITATLGPVAEPYLHSFPKPKDFFTELYKGDCLVEAYYKTKPFNSWMLVLIGDPLYRPFKEHAN